MAIKCALQLQCVREIMRFDPIGTIEKVADAGYRYIELTNHVVETPYEWYGLKAETLRKLAEKRKLHIIGGYVKRFAPDNAEAVIKYYKELGSERIVIPIDYFPTQAILNEKCDMYNTLGEMCKKNGLELYYENHYHEFQTIDGGMVMDLLMERTKPELFHIALNNYWLMRGLVDPIETLHQYAPRIGSLTLQDYPLDQMDKFNVWGFHRFHPISKNIQKHVPLKGGEIENINPVHCALFTEIGSGIFKLQELINEADKLGGIRYAVLRQDYTRMDSEFESIRVSMANAKKLQGLRWD